MSRPVSVGYATIPNELLALSYWLVVPAGQEAAANPSQIPNWQYSTDLIVERTVAVNLGRIMEASQLNDGDDIRWVVTWTASSTGLQGASVASPLSDGSNAIQVRIPGTEVGGTLRLRTLLTASPIEGPRSPLAAHRPGATLWSDELTVELEGDMSRFPTEALSFEVAGVGGRDEAWRLSLDASDLDAPALSCLRVILNTDHEVYARLTNASESPEASVTRHFLAYDVARQLVVAALTSDELDAIDYERGSLGHVMRARLRDYFGEEGDDVSPLRSRWTVAPNEVDAELQRFFAL